VDAEARPYGEALMAEITQEQQRLLEQDMHYMRQAKMSQTDIDAYLDSRLNEMGAGGFMSLPFGEQAKRVSGQAAMFAGPYLGGVYGAQAAAGRNVLPFLGGAGRALTQFGGEAAGITAGDIAGRFAAGVKQEPIESLKVGGGGAAIGTLLRGATQFGGYIGNLPEQTTLAAAEPLKAGRVPLPLPNLKRVMRAGPHTIQQVKAGVSPESQLVERASEAARKLEQTITKQRLEKVAIIRQADASGVRIPVAPVQDALREHLITDPGTITREARIVNMRIQDTISSLDRVSAQSGGTLSPGQVDKVIRQQLRPRIYTGSGQPSHSMYAGPIASAEESATKLLTDALPGDIAAKNAAISEQLTAAENAVKLFGDPDKAGVASRLSTAFNKNNETSARALNTLAKHDPKLVDDTYDLYVRRQFSGDIREPPAGGQSGAFGTMVRKPFELGTRAIAPFQRFAGGTSAGLWEAFIAKHAKLKTSPTTQEPPALWKETAVSPEQMFPGLTNIGQDR